MGKSTVYLVLLLFFSCNNTTPYINHNKSTNNTTSPYDIYLESTKKDIKEKIEDYIKLDECDNTGHFNKDPNTFLQILFKDINDIQNVNGTRTSTYKPSPLIRRDCLRLANTLFEIRCKELKKELKSNLTKYKKQLRNTKVTFINRFKYLFCGLDDKKSTNTDIKKNYLQQQVKATEDSIKKINDFVKIVKYNLQNSIYNYNDFSDLNDSYLMKNYFNQSENKGHGIDNNVDLKKIGLQIISDIKNDKRKFRVITMTGYPGVGKTYLAQCIMNDLSNMKCSEKYIYIDQSDKIQCEGGNFIIKRKCGNDEVINFDDISLLIWDDVAFMDAETVNKDQTLKKDHKDLYNLIKLLEQCKKHHITIYISSNNDNLRNYFKKCIDNKIINNKAEIKLIEPFFLNNSNDVKKSTKTPITLNENDYLLKNLNLVGVRKGIINYFAKNKIYHDTDSLETKNIFYNLIYTFIKDKSSHDTNGGVVYLPIDWFRSLIKNTTNQGETLTIEIEEKNEEEITKIKNLSNDINIVRYDNTNKYSITIPLKLLEKRVDIIDTSKKLYTDPYNNEVRLYIKDNPRQVSGTEIIARGAARGTMLKHYLYGNLSYEHFHSVCKRINNNYCRTLPELSRNNFNNKKLSLVLFDKATSQYLIDSNKLRSINEQYSEIASNAYKMKKSIRSQAKAEVSNHVLDPFKTFVYGAQLYSDDNKNMSFLAGYFSRLKCSTIIFNNDSNINDSSLSLLYTGAKIKKRITTPGRLWTSSKFIGSSFLVVTGVYYFIGSAIASLLTLAGLHSWLAFLIGAPINLILGLLALPFIDKYIINKCMPQVKCHLPSNWEIVAVMGITTPAVLILSSFFSIPLIYSGAISALLLILSGFSMFFK